jgi:hypothetical protein
MPKVITVWAPGGNNTAQLSLNLARKLARQKKVLLVELPCLGIPRLGFAAGIMDRDNHTEAAIIELGKKVGLTLTQLHKKSEMLALLPAGVFAVPDYPVTLKVELETLIEFPAALIQKATQLCYELIVFECQGQLTTPMTFFAIKLADTVIVSAEEPAEIAYSLINIKRLIQMCKYLPEKFKVVSAINSEELSEVMVMKDEEGKITSRIEVLTDNPAELAIILDSDYGYEEKLLDKAAGKKGRIIAMLSGILLGMKGNYTVSKSDIPQTAKIQKIRL